NRLPQRWWPYRTERSNRSAKKGRTQVDDDRAQSINRCFVFGVERAVLVQKARRVLTTHISSTFPKCPLLIAMITRSSFSFGVSCSYAAARISCAIFYFVAARIVSATRPILPAAVA